MEHVEHVRFGDQLYAIIVRASFREPGIHFFSTPELSQQLAYMSHPKGKSIEPHRHNKVTREVHYTQEVLLIQKGKLQVDFYTVEEAYLESRVLGAGDIILLCSGAHGFSNLGRKITNHKHEIRPAHHAHWNGTIAPTVRKALFFMFRLWRNLTSASYTMHMYP